MARILTGDRLINSVRRRTMTPDDVSVYTDDDILDTIDEEMTVQVLDKLIALHGENLTISVDVAKNEDNSYTIPYRAIGNKLRDVSLIQGNQIYELSQISIGEIPDYNHASNGKYINDYFYVENNQVKLVNSHTNYDKIRIRYYLRPNYLTKVDKAGIIAAKSYNELEGTVTIALSQMGKFFTAASIYDIIEAKTPNKIRAFDLNLVDFVNNGSTGNLVFSYDSIKDIYDSIQVGDYVSLAGETPVPNIPTEMHPLIAQAVAVQILDSLGDSESLGNAERRLKKISDSVQFLIDDRVELAPKRIKPRHGTLRFNRANLPNKGSY